MSVSILSAFNVSLPLIFDERHGDGQLCRPLRLLHFALQCRRRVLLRARLLCVVRLLLLLLLLTLLLLLLLRLLRVRILGGGGTTVTLLIRLNPSTLLPPLPLFLLRFTKSHGHFQICVVRCALVVLVLLRKVVVSVDHFVLWRRPCVMRA